jgi:hypothetical protein
MTAGRTVIQQLALVPFGAFRVLAFMASEMQKMLLNFSEGGTRQLVDDHEGPGDLERSHGCAARGFQGRGIRRASRYDVGNGHFPAQRIGDTDNRRLGNRFLFLEKLLDLARINVEAS